MAGNILGCHALSMCDLLSKNLAHPHFERIELRPEIIMVTFDLSTEQIFKAIDCPVAKKQFEVHVGYEKISCKLNFLMLLCSSVYHLCYVSSIVSI